MTKRFLDAGLRRYDGQGVITWLRIIA